MVGLQIVTVAFPSEDVLMEEAANHALTTDRIPSGHTPSSSLPDLFNIFCVDQSKLIGEDFDEGHVVFDEPDARRVTRSLSHLVHPQGDADADLHARNRVEFGEQLGEAGERVGFGLLNLVPSLRR